MAMLTMPTLGADMSSGTLIAWRVGPGDQVTRGDIVATIDTDKAEIDIETFDDGVVEELLVAPGTQVDVGAPLARIGSGEAVVAAAPAEGAAPDGAAAPVAPPETAAPAAASAAPPVPPAPAAPPVPPVAPAPAEAAVPPPGRRRVSPLARRVAAELGVDPERVTGTGPGGAVTRVDVERAAAAPAPTAPAPLSPAAPPSPDGPAATAPPVPRRSADDRARTLARAVGDLMARSKREIPHYHLSREIDLTTPLAWLEHRNAARPAAERVLPAALLLRAVALAAHDVPEVNGTYEDAAFRPADRVDLGVAVSLRSGGIIAPSILAADTLALDELMRALHECTARARRGGLRQTDLAGATLTVTSLGDHGADLVHGVIFPPQVALVGFGRIDWRPYAAGDLLAARRTVVATLAGDHRVSDGHRGSLFLASVDHHLQEPDAL